MGHVIIALIFGVVVLLICRSITLWYFKLDKIERHLGEMVLQLKLMNGTTESFDHKPRTFVEGLRKGMQ
jgi:hypothetical protein